MCICTTRVLQITLLALIHIAAGFNGAQIAKDITLLDKLVGHHHVILTISLALCVIILVVLLVAIFAAIRQHILALNVTLICLILKCVAKGIIVIVCTLTAETTIENTAAHLWFILCWIFTGCCMIFNLFFYMRLTETSREAA
ncbi:uncharacterized protein LOC26526078 [Drosophila erecta]|uniref:Uncharacterized protein n=1 Tax=Drosophila erecta TaxID=7220 RepID=A0A0Q5UHG1_DROER|nr:uncharacterized protein LOC26526078 [Drosophila erecta]KQS43319.1 uncharacterized protein Dere_GG26254 [Drosophila erecta]